MDIWKSIPGFESYHISSTGQVRGLRGWILSPNIQDGYKSVTLSLNGEAFKYSVHRLMATTFLDLELADTKTIVNHKDGNPGNNSIDNLEVCNQSHNQLHTSKLQYPGDSSTHKTCRKCKMLKSIYEFWVNKHSPDGRNHFCKHCKLGV